MRRVLLIVLIAMAALAAYAGTAKADPGNVSCGGRVEIVTWYFTSNGAWNMIENHWCGDQKVYTLEIQHTTDGGLHWYDWATADIRSGPCNSGCTQQVDHEITNETCANTGSYRYHPWWADGDVASAKVGAGLVCSGSINH